VRQATVYIDQEALQYNLNRVKQLAPTAKIVSMVKANAYGHGVEACLAALSSSDAFGVACLEEALEIRELGYEQPITLIEGIFSDDEMQIIIEKKIECVVHHQQQLDWLLAHKDAYIAQGLKVWVKLNSGMNRLGDVKEACAPIMGSCCNSAAIFKWPELNFDFVRPGIMLYGASPFADKTVHDLDIKPVMTFTAEVIALNTIQAGESVGYGSTFVADQAMDLAIVSIGYGDGYPRAFPKQNYVAVNGQPTRVIGRVAMDMIAIDATGLKINLGTEVELWGKNRLVDDVAEANGTIGYELLCRLSARPVRKLK